MVELVFFFISSASLLFWLLFGNFFFFQLIFSTLMKDQTGNSLVQAEAMYNSLFFSSICLLPIFKKKMSKEIGLAKF